MKITVGQRAVEISNPEKPLFPRDGITKADLAGYYLRVAPVLLPHVRGRFISMERFPDGIGGYSFIQKDVPGHFPNWIRTELVEKEGGTLCQVVVEDAATLVYLASQACVTPHMWLSRAVRRRHPDRMVLDFDPSEEDPGAVRRAARDAADLLEALGLVPFVMTSGSRGFHVHVPLAGRQDFDVVRAFARDVARLLVAREPDRLTVEQRKDRREGRIFVDVLRNGYAQTTVAPYSVRPLDSAPVATPLDRRELSRSTLHPRRYTVANLFRRLERWGDPWKGMSRRARSLARPRKALARLLDEAGEGSG